MISMAPSRILGRACDDVRELLSQEVAERSAAGEGQVLVTVRVQRSTLGSGGDQIARRRNPRRKVRAMR
jgi:hypothetical protein